MNKLFTYQNLSIENVDIIIWNGKLDNEKITHYQNTIRNVVLPEEYSKFLGLIEIQMMKFFKG